MLLLDFFPYPARYQFVNYLRFFLKETAINTTFTHLLRKMNFFLCAKFWFSSILCAEVIASDSHIHFPNVIKPIRPRPIIYLRRARTRRTERRRREKRNGCIVSFYIGYFGDSFWLTLQLDIQSKSNFAHKVEPKLNIVRLLLLFRVYVWEVLIMLTTKPFPPIHLVYE